MFNIIRKIRDYLTGSSLDGRPIAYKIGTPQGLKKRLSREWDRGDQRQAYHDLYHFDALFATGNCTQILADYHCTTRDTVIRDLEGYKQTSQGYVKEDKEYGANEDIISDEEDNVFNYDMKIKRIQMSPSFFFATDDWGDVATASKKDDFMKAVDNIISAAQARSKVNA